MNLNRKVTMKKILLSALACGAFLYSHAQTFTTTNGTDRYIEVKVSDTMRVEADIIKVKIALPAEGGMFEWAKDDYDDYEYDDYPYEEVAPAYEEPSKKKKKKKNKQVEEETYEYVIEEAPVQVDAAAEAVEEVLPDNKELIEEYLNKKGINFKFHEAGEPGANPFTRGLDLMSNSYEVILNSRAEYEALKEHMATLDGVEVSVVSASSSKQTEYELQLIERLYKKGNAEAAVIAKAMGVALDKPLNVSNTTWESVMTSMISDPKSLGGLGAIMSLITNMFKAPEDATIVIIQKSLLIHFGIK